MLAAPVCHQFLLTHPFSSGLSLSPALSPMLLQPAVTGIVVGEDALEVDPEYAAYEDQISMEEELASLNSDHSCSSSEGAAVPHSLSLSLSRQNLTRMVSKSKVVLSSATSLAVKGLMKGASKTKVFAQNLRARRQSGQQQQSGLLASTGPECGSGELACSEGEADEEDEEEVIVDSRASSSASAESRRERRPVAASTFGRRAPAAGPRLSLFHVKKKKTAFASCV